MSAFQV